MDWNSLLDDLWKYTASDPKELESKIRSCLKGHSTESFLRDISEHIVQGQHGKARQRLNDHLAHHSSAESIHRRLELILLFKKHRSPQPLSIKSKQLSKELLIKGVNDLVAASKLQAAETLLLDAIETIEDPDYINLLGRVYMLQRRPKAAAEALQKGLILQRQQKAFVETNPEESDLPTEDDLAFLNTTAGGWASFDTPSSPEIKPLSDTVDVSLSYIQHTATLYPSLEPDSWWDKTETVSSNPSVSGDGTQFSEAAPLPERTDGSTNKIAPDDQTSQPATRRPILKLNRARKNIAPDEDKTAVQVTSSSRGSFFLTPAAKPVKLESAADASEQTSLSATPAISAIPAPHSGEDQKSEQPAGIVPSVVAQPGPIAPTAIEAEDLQDDEPAEANDIYEQDDFTEFDAHDEQTTQTCHDDFRDLDDEYAAYVYDPDEVFDEHSDYTTELDDGFVDKISREERALQKAAELIAKVGWPQSTLPLIQQIFIMSGWGATRLALEREIEKGVTPDELILAAHIKAIWAENDIYWISFSRSGSSQLSHQTLSWPNALLVVRSFESLPQVDEIEFFLEEIFTSWYENPTLRRAFKAFARYLWFRFANLDGCLPANQHFDFCSPEELPIEEYSDLGLYDVLDIEETEVLRDYGVFQTKHPQEPGCYFSDLPPKREEEYEAKAALIEKLERKQAAQSAKHSIKIKDEAEQELVAEDNANDDLPQWSPKPVESALHPENYQHSLLSTEPSR